MIHTLLLHITNDGTVHAHDAVALVVAGLAGLAVLAYQLRGSRS